MTCSIIGNNVQVLMPSQNDTAPVTGSALQNPDLSRAQLGALLRRKSPTISQKSTQRTFWSSFMAQVVASNANSNQ